MGRVREFIKRNREGIASNLISDFIWVIIVVVCGTIASFFITNKWDFLRIIPTIGKFWAFIAYFVMAAGAVFITHQVGKFVLRFVKSKQKKTIPTESSSKRRAIITLFSSQLDELTKGKSISGLGISFLKKVKTAPPFLGIQHTQPVISPIDEQKLTEFLLAQEFVQTNGRFIRVGKTYVVKREDTWESIAKDVYGNEKFSDNIMVANPGIYLLMAGMVIKLPYIDISTSLGLSSEEIEKRYIKSQRDWIEPTLEYLRKQFYIIDDEVLSLVSWIYKASKIAAAEHALAPNGIHAGRKKATRKKSSQSARAFRNHARR